MSGQINQIDEKSTDFVALNDLKEFGSGRRKDGVDRQLAHNI
jgi:hypothetical protein